MIWLLFYLERTCFIFLLSEDVLDEYLRNNEAEKAKPSEPTIMEETSDSSDLE